MCSATVRMLALEAAAHVGGDAFATVQNLDAVAGHACPDLLAHQAVWHAVVMAADLDVVVDVHTALVEGGDLVALGGQRTQHRLIQSLEPFTPVAFALPEWPLVQFSDQPGNGTVEFGQTVEAVVSQPGQHPALDDLHTHFDLGLVLRFAWTGRQHGRGVVVHEVLRGVAQHRFVAVGAGDQRLRVVGYEQLGHAADELQRITQATDPVGRRLERVAHANV